MNRLLPASLLAIAGILLGHAGQTIWLGERDDAQRVAWGAEVHWIGPAEPAYQAYFRRTVYIEASPQSAWIRFSADSNFELYVNGNLVSRERSPTNHAKGLAGGLDSSIGQQLNESRLYRASIEPLVSPWKSPDWKLCVYESIGKYLVPGRNVIAVLVSSTDTKPRFALEGAIEISPERSVRLATGEQDWKVSSVAENVGDLTWYDPSFRDEHWSRAPTLKPLTEATYSRLSQTAIGRTPRGQWITGPVSATGEVWLRGQWKVPNIGRKSFVRTAANTSAAVTINGQLIDDPAAARQGSGQLLIYDTSNLLERGSNEIIVKLRRPLAEQQPGLGGAPPQFYLDGWIETDDEAVQSEIHTGGDWLALGGSEPQGGEPNEHERQALVNGTRGLYELSRAYRGDASQYDYLAIAADGAAWMIAGIALVFSLAHLLAEIVVGKRVPREEKWKVAVGLLLPGTVMAVAIGVLTHRYSESDMSLVLTEHRAAILTLVGFATATCLAIVAQVRADTPRSRRSTNRVLFATLAVATAVVLSLAWHEPGILLGGLATLGGGMFALHAVTDDKLNWFHARMGQLLSNRALTGALLLGVVMVGVFLRWRDLGFQDLWADENTSLDAIRGILRTGGVPETTSGIWYTRSPAYHYAAAGWLKLFGDTIIAARGFSVVWGSALLVVAFLFTKQLTRSNGMSLFVTAFLALDQWLIVGSKLIRFYVLIEFLTLLCFYLFYKGYVDRERPIYRYLFFIPLILAILSQEVMITLVPIFALGFLMFYKPIRLRDDWPLGLLLGLTLLIFFFDLLVFDVKCLTPPVALGTTTDSIAKPHLKYVTGFASSFFAGASRLHIVFTFFFIVGFVHSIAARDARRLFLYAFVLLYLAELTILVRQVSLRYTSPAHPIFLILAVTGAFEAAGALASRLSAWTTSPRALGAMTSIIVVLALILGDEYPRLFFKSEERLVRGATQVTRYIRDHARESDIVMSPIPPSAAVELGGLDYFIASNTLYFDVPYRDGNLVRDRWGGGVLISNPEALSRAFETAERVWIYSDEPAEARLSPAMRFQLRTIGRPVMESYAATLRLWERNRDPFPIIPREGRSLGAY